MKITVLTDNRKSWFTTYGHQLVEALHDLGHESTYVHDKRDIKKGQICFLLSCVNIVGSKYLERNTHNIVIHASDLPCGKGFSPLQWQILEGKNEIVLTLFEAVDEVDAGPYYIKDTVKYEGTELYNEIRNKLAEKIIEMCLYYISNIKNLNLSPQKGIESFYPRRTTIDDMIDIDKSIMEQFNHFRIADNINYPLWFEYRGVRYKIKIEKS